MEKVIFALLALVVGMIAYAQDKSEQAHNIISVSGGIGTGSWSISNDDFNFDSKKENSSFGFDLSYQHVWNKGFGIGANVALINYDIYGNGKDKEHITYVGPPCSLPIGHICHDTQTMQRVYEMGRTAGAENLDAVKAFAGSDN